MCILCTSLWKVLFLPKRRKYFTNKGVSFCSAKSKSYVLEAMLTPTKVVQFVILAINKQIVKKPYIFYGVYVNVQTATFVNSF